jgi:hypothetical protein
MKKLVTILCFCLAYMQIGGREVLAFNFYFGDVGTPVPNEVHIGNTAIVMPLGKILLVRRDSEYCAIKFTKFWTGKTEDDLFAKYESYYQGDKTGNFTNKNVKLKKEELSFPKPRGIGRLAFSFGNMNIECGTVKLLWTGQGAVHFYREGQHQGDYGIELAPTPWTDISQVNVRDPRIKWYRYDEKRKRVNIPLEHLWDKKVNKK